MSAPRVLLVDMPFASASHPSLGLGSLQATLRDAGVVCDVAYPKILFAREIGVAAYERIALDLPHPALAGEWVFAGCLYQGGRQPAAGYVDDVLRARWSLPDDDVDLVLEARAVAPGFLDDYLATIDWHAYDVVGFSCSSAQNLASLALARRVKEVHPGALTVFGGSSWDEGMGEELHRRFPFVDVGVSGEAEESLLALVRWLGTGGGGLEQIPGICHRSGGAVINTGPARPVADIEALPLPDYDDYLVALRESALSHRIRPSAHAETCRGCWWASRHACRFCGSPGCRRSYRAKSPEKVVAELRALGRQPFSEVVIVDDVPSPEFFDQVLPELAARPLPVSLFCEVRPEVTREQVRLLGSCRARVQPGIESLSDSVLRRMRKGSRGLENLRLLRWCREEGVVPSWNFMYGLPGEDPEEYARMLELLPAVRFLQPPEACGPVRLDRFSEYAARPAHYGWHNVRPLRSYRYLYPFPEASLRRIAYAFEYDWEPGNEPAGYVAPLREAVESWIARPDEGAPRLSREDGETIVTDDRGENVRVRRLDDLEAAVYEAGGDICRREGLVERLAGSFPGKPRLTERIDDALTSFVEQRLMVRDGDRYLSLALRNDG
jgi:ribosomal peptide maturation radical SAM protein 1